MSDPLPISCQYPQTTRDRERKQTTKIHFPTRIRSQIGAQYIHDSTGEAKIMSLLEVDEVLRINKVPLTREEAEVLNSWRNKAIRDLGVGISVGSVATWLVTGRLHNFYRFNLAAAVGMSYGLWRCSKSLDSSVERSLSLHGTRLQRELAGIIVKKYQDDPLGMRLVSKYFVPENVYDDSSPDKPKQRWRLRNFFGETLDSFRRTQDDSYGEDAFHLGGNNNMYKTNAREDSFVSRRKTNKKSDLEQQKMSTDDEATSDPFDCVFGPPDNVDEMHHQSPNSSDKLPRKHGRIHRRSRRRHHQETSDGP